jgi:BNR repeat-like domain
MLLLIAALAAQIVPSGDARYAQPQLAVRGTQVALTFGSAQTVYVAISEDAARTFAAPVAVSSSGELALGMRRGPRVAYSRDALVVSAIVGSEGHGKDGDVVAWRSTDGGKTWSRPVRVNDVAGSAREGLHAMAAGGKNTLFAAWLDLRASGTRVYGSTSRDGGATWSPNRLVYESPSGTVCQCCHPSVAVDGTGRILVMFRNAVDGARDFYLVQSEDGGQSFGPGRKVGTGSWKLEACPMDGGGLAVDDSGHVATAWRREGTVYTTEGDRPEAALATGRNPTIVATRPGTTTAWTDDGRVRVRGPASAETRVLGEGAFPVLALLPDGSSLIAWEGKAGLQVLPLPTAAGRTDASTR